MRDPYLSAIIAGVESSGDPVSMSFALKSGAVVNGFVRRSQFFASVTCHETDLARQKAEPRKHRASDSYSAALAAQAERIEAAFGKVEDDAGDSDSITLSDVKMVWNNGDGLQLKTVRLDLDAIAAWWVVPGSVIKGGKDTGGFWAVGVTF